MTVKALFQTWTALKDILTDPREVEAGPCQECDALLDAALRDRALILERRSGPGIAASG